MVKPTMHQAQQYIHKVHDMLERRQVHELDFLQKAPPAWLAWRIATREQSSRITGAIQIGFAVHMYTAVHTKCTTLQSDKYEKKTLSSICKPLCYLTSITSMYRSFSCLGILRLSILHLSILHLSILHLSISHLSVLRLSISASCVSASQHLIN